MKIVTNYFWLSLIFFVFIGFIGFNACSASSLGSTNSSIISDHQLIYQQERQKALESALSNPLPNVRFQAGSVKHQTINFPSESPCFQISSVELLERDTLPYIIPLYPILIQAGVNNMSNKIVMRWIEAGKSIATDPSVKVLCPICQKVYLKVMDVPNENNPSEIERQMLCDECGAFNALRLTR